MRDQLDLTPMERYETRGVVQEHLVMMSIGLMALVLAAVNLPQFAGMSYLLIAPAQTILGTVHGRKRRLLGLDPPAVAA
jgi:hypothetical protein